MTVPMPRNLLLSAVLLVMSAATALPASAQSRNCAERERVVERLSDTYGESRQSIGLAANNQVMEVFANLESGSWTVTVTLPSGITCLIASGMAYEDIEDALTPTGSSL